MGRGGLVFARALLCFAGSLVAKGDVQRNCVVEREGRDGWNPNLAPPPPNTCHLMFSCGGLSVQLGKPCKVRSDCVLDAVGSVSKGEFCLACLADARLVFGGEAFPVLVAEIQTLPRWRVVRSKERTPENSDCRPFVMCVGIWRCTAELRKLARWGVEGEGVFLCIPTQVARTEVVPKCCSPGV